MTRHLAGGNAARRRGRGRELDMLDFLRSRGYVAFRLAWGSADIIGLKAGAMPLLVQVKSTSRPYERFGPRDRDHLAADAIAAGAEPVLAWWPPSHDEPTLYPYTSWPVAKAAA